MFGRVWYDRRLWDDRGKRSKCYDDVTAHVNLSTFHLVPVKKRTSPRVGGTIGSVICPFRVGDGRKSHDFQSCDAILTTLIATSYSAYWAPLFLKVLQYPHKVLMIGRDNSELLDLPASTLQCAARGFGGISRDWNSSKIIRTNCLLRHRWLPAIFSFYNVQNGRLDLSACAEEADRSQWRIMGHVLEGLRSF